MKISELLKDVPLKKVSKTLIEEEATDVVFESKRVTKGSLFVSLHADKEEEAEAKRRGAVAIVCEGETANGETREEEEEKERKIFVNNVRVALSLLAGNFYANPSKKLKLIGVTGTNGKTTVTNMLASVFQAAEKKVGVIGTLGAFFGGREYPCSLTTPDPVYFQFLLSEMVKGGVEYCFAEISAHALFFEKESCVSYRAVVFTNFTQDHLDFFEGMSSYFAAKQKLFLARNSEYAVLNADDECYQELIAPNKKTITYALKTPSDAFAVIQEENLEGTLALLNVNDELIEVKLSLLGEFNVLNALAAAVVAREEGISSQVIGAGLSSMKGVAGRLERAGEKNGGNIFIDFAHTPDGLEKSLLALKKFCKGKLYCLFGCGGNRDKGKRPKMGKIASEIADGIILSSDNPRYEDPFEILKEIESGVKNGCPTVIIEEREEAISYAIHLLQKGDILLVAGKGAERTQEKMGIKREYSDDTVIKRNLE